jgi:hypothetical protein
MIITFTFDCCIGHPDREDGHKFKMLAQAVGELKRRQLDDGMQVLLWIDYW